MRNKIGNILWGLFFMFLGIGLAGRFLLGWNFTIFFDGWWTLFIIIPCLISIIETGCHFPNTFGLVLGAIFFLSCQDGLGYFFSWKLIIPLFFIFLGLSIILSPFTKKFRKNVHYNTETGQATFQANKKMSVSFGEKTFVHTSEFDGCEISCTFGSLTLDLRNARITNSCTIDCSNSFGQTTILLPPNINLSVNISPTFGEVDNRYNHIPYDSTKPTVVVQGSCSFGEIELL